MGARPASDTSCHHRQRVHPSSYLHHFYTQRYLGALRKGGHFPHSPSPPHLFRLRGRDLACWRHARGHSVHDQPPGCQTGLHRSRAVGRLLEETDPPRQASMSGSGWETQSVSEIEECGLDEAWQFTQCQVSSVPQREQGARGAGRVLAAHQAWDASHPTFSPLSSLCTQHWVQAPRPSVSILGPTCGCLNLCQARRPGAGVRFRSLSENCFLSNPSSCPSANRG